MIFTHTCSEPGLWRGWLRNGQSVELSRSRSGWDFGAGILVHMNDDDRGSRMLCVKFWRWSAYLPLGFIDCDSPVGDEPQWSAFGSSEFGMWMHWGARSWLAEWPWSLHTVAYETKMVDGSWGDVLDRSRATYTESHPYTYTLQSGEVQRRTATVSIRRHILTYRGLSWLPFPRWARHSIDVEFDGEVGERSGSWKGGVIACGYTMSNGETPLDTLRRMERERTLR